jgi:hypothetical protein
MTMPVIILKNGLRVGNFSSPHGFEFSTGEFLPSCTPDRTERLKLDSYESEFPGILGTTDIEIVWKLSPDVERELAKVNARDDVDIVLIPFPVLEVLRRCNRPLGKCRVIRTVNRVTKTIHPDRFCR